jgi:hypothetical protein
MLKPDSSHSCGEDRKEDLEEDSRRIWQYSELRFHQDSGFDFHKLKIVIAMLPNPGALGWARENNVSLRNCSEGVFRLHKFCDKGLWMACTRLIFKYIQDAIFY